MLSRKTFFIREHVGFLKLSDTYDILDPETQKTSRDREGEAGHPHPCAALSHKQAGPAHEGLCL